MGEKTVKNNGSMRENMHQLIQVQSPARFVKLTGNMGFCNQFFIKPSMAVLPIEISESHERSEDLVYSFSSTSGFDSEHAFNKIIDLLSELKDITSGQNAPIQNNTVLRDQIINQLKNEVLRSRTNLTTQQIKNLEVVSSNNFDEKTLTDILRSLLESAKKKSDEKSPLTNGEQGKTSKKNRTPAKKIAEDYFKILKNVRNYSKVVEDIHNRVIRKNAINPVGEKKSDQEIFNKHEKIAKNKIKNFKYISDEINEILNPKIIEEIQESFEKNVVNKISKLSPIIKLQSKISELSIMSNVTEIMDRILERSVPKVLRTNTKLINKIVDKSEIKELKENVVAYQQQYENERVVHQRSLDRVYNDIRKVYSAKTFSQNVFEVLKSSRFRNVNFEEAIKKNLLKVTAKNEVVNRIKSIYEKQIQKENIRRTVDKTKFVNRENIEVLSNEERSAVDEVVDFVHHRPSHGERFRRNTDRIINRIQNVYERQIQEENAKKFINKTRFINKENVKTLDVEEREAVDEIVKLRRKNRSVERNFYNKTSVIDKIFNDVKFKNTNYKTVLDNIDLISNKFREEKNVLKRIFASHLINSENANIVNQVLKINNLMAKNQKLTTLNKSYLITENEFKFKPVYLRDKIIKGEEIENIVEKNVKKVLAPSTFTQNLFKKKIKLKRIFASHLINSENADIVNQVLKINKLMAKNQKLTTLNKSYLITENEFKFKPVYLRDKIIKGEEIENIVEKNVKKVLAPSIFTQSSFKTKVKDVYRDIVAPKIIKHVKNDDFSRKVYAIHKSVTSPTERLLDYADSRYIVYKEEPKVIQKEAEPVPEKPKKSNATIKGKNDALRSKVISQQEKIDTKSIEKSIMAKTLSRNDVEMMIDSRLGGINIEAISRAVINKVESKIRLNNKRTGVF